VCALVSECLQHQPDEAPSFSTPMSTFNGVVRDVPDGSAVVWPRGRTGRSPEVGVLDYRGLTQPMGDGVGQVLTDLGVTRAACRGVSRETSTRPRAAT
jgi:hypothetical protein